MGHDATCARPPSGSADGKLITYSVGREHTIANPAPQNSSLGGPVWPILAAAAAERSLTTLRFGLECSLRSAIGSIGCYPILLLRQIHSKIRAGAGALPAEWLNCAPLTIRGPLEREIGPPASWKLAAARLARKKGIVLCCGPSFVCVSTRASSNPAADSDSLNGGPAITGNRPAISREEA